MVVQRMYKYRLYPSRKQKKRLINSLKICKQIYNELLAISIDTYKFGKISLSKFDYDNYLTGKYLKIYSQIKGNISDRIHKAFQNFFRRIKNPKIPKSEKGFPRFKSRINSITYPQNGFKFLSDKKLKVSKIGNIPIVLHRIPKGKIKTLTIKQNKIGQWFAIFSCELSDIHIKHTSTKKIGLDVGLENFATLSNKEIITNPHHLIKSEKMIKLLHRRLGRKKKGSNNRRKARFRLAKQYLKVDNQRNDFLHKISNKITKSFYFVAVEDLNIKDMVNNSLLAKSIGDVSWGAFINMLSYKAVNCGGQLIKVNPKNTSKTCSRCGIIIDMPLSKREFVCPKCGFACNRDLNASINILRVGTDCSELNACGHNVRPSSKAVVEETRTKCDIV